MSTTSFMLILLDNSFSIDNTAMDESLSSDIVVLRYVFISRKLEKDRSTPAVEGGIVRKMEDSFARVENASLYSVKNLWNFIAELMRQFFSNS